MAKTKADLGIQGHLNGDADGLGLFRGLKAALVIECVALVAFGAFLYVFWQ